MPYLGHLAWVDVPSHRELLVIPLGATEQHGPHLPLSTDTDIAVAISARLAAQSSRVVVAPAVAYGSSGEHQSFSGTLSVGQSAIELLLVELVRSACVAFQRVLLVSCHGGNAEPVSRAIARVRAEGRDVRAWSPAPVWGGDAHAGVIETSVMLALDPEHVRMERAGRGNERPVDELMPAMRDRGVVAVSPTGVLGDPTPASSEIGEQLLADAVDVLVDMVEDWLTPGRLGR